MKANIEIDLREVFVGYGNDGEEYTADFGDSIREAIISHIIRDNAININNTINKKIQEAIGVFVDETLNIKIDKMLNNFLDEKITISNGYTKTNYDSLLDYVEQKMQKVYKENLSGASCTKDLLLEKINSKIEVNIRNEISTALKKVTQEGEKIAKDTLAKDSGLLAIKQILKGTK